MANEKVQFKRGLSANLPSTKTAGQILVETDTGNMYLDDSADSRVQIKDNTKIESLSVSGKVVTYTKGDGTTGTITTQDTDTHYTTHLYVGANTGASNAATANGATYIKVADNTTARDAKLIKGTGATTVTSDASGSITINSTDTTYSAATASADGLMSAADKTKLNGIATGATKITVDTALSSTSTNPVQNKVINTALGNKLNTSLKGAANGLAELGSDGKVPSSQLPSFVDDVVEGYYYNSKFYTDDAHKTEITGETGKIYVNLSDNKTYRWSGSAFVVISETLALGETSSTAYAGDKGKVAYDHSQLTSGNPHNVTKSDIGLGNVENKSSATIRGELTKANVTTALGYTPPTANTNTTYTLTQDATDGHKITLTPSSGTATTITIPDNDTTYSAATTSAAGLMSAADKTKLNGIATGANKITVDSSLSSTSTNPVQNKVINTALAGKAASSHTHNAFTGATASAAGTAGFVPSPAAGANTKYLKGDATWDDPLNAIALTTEDLNDIRTEGFYYWGSSNGTLAGTGGLDNLTAFNLEVIRTGTNNYAQKLITSHILKKQYIRWYNNGSWTDWIEITNIANLDGVLPITKGGTGASTRENAYRNLSMTYITTANTSLDDYTTPGWYTFAATAQAPIDSPAASGVGHLYVVSAVESASIVNQIWFSSSMTMAYARFYASGAWNEWIQLKLTDTTYSNATTSAAGLMSAADKTSLDALTAKVAGYAVTGGTSTAYTASVTGAKLTEGTVLFIRFNVANGASATLNVNSLGAKPIYYKNAAITANIIPAQTVAAVVYDTTLVTTGTWRLVYSRDTTYTLTQDASDGHKLTFTPLNGTATTITIPDNDTHYTTHLYAGTSSGTANAATTNGNTYLIVADNTTARDRRKIAGTGATTVTSDASGNITINSTDTVLTWGTF